MALVKVVLQDMLQALELVMFMFMFSKVLRSTVQALELVMFMFMAVLQSMPSPLEMCACIVVLDCSDAKNYMQIVLAVTSLFLAVCDWHVPRVILYDNLICRFLSAICMQALMPYSPTLTCLALLYPTFGKRAQSTPTPEPECGVGVSEHVSTSAGDKISLDEVIAKLEAAGTENTRSQEILVAANLLRDSRGRFRQTSLRKMAKRWGVTLSYYAAGRYKPRPNSSLVKEIQDSVCEGFLAWHSWSKRNGTRSPSRADAEAVLKKARTIGAAEHGAVVATPTAGTLHHLPETAEDVLALSRLGPNMYQGTLRSGKI